MAQDAPASGAVEPSVPNRRASSGVNVIVNGHPGANRTTTRMQGVNGPSFTPIAICGMACRLAGGIHSPQRLWDFILAGKDARSKIPESRFNISSYYSKDGQPGTINTQHGYFLAESVDLGAIDMSFSTMSKTEADRLDPQQRLLVEVAREAVDDAGEVAYLKGQNVGVYVGTYGQDWYDVFNRDPDKYSACQLAATHDFMASERVSHEMDLRGPSMTIRTACSSSLVGLNEACLALARKDCKSAIVGGSNLILSPGLMASMCEQGVLSSDGSCKTFSADADGYARGEGVVAIYIKTLEDAIANGDPVRAVISGAATNFDGKTPLLSLPNSSAQEALIRRAYELAGIPDSDFCKTALFECHGTGTRVGDKAETDAVAAVFGDSGILISSIKPSVGHTDGASGITSVIKAVLSLENKTIAPSIKSQPSNPNILFKEAGLTVPLTAMQWPSDRSERVSVNSFGIGGANAHAIVESAAMHIARNSRPAKSVKLPADAPQLLLLSANTTKSLETMITNYRNFLDQNPKNASELANIASTLAHRRGHMPYRSFTIANRDGIKNSPPTPNQGPRTATSVVMVFTGQGAQWPQMGRTLFKHNPVFSRSIKELDDRLQELENLAPSWTIQGELLKPSRSSRVNEAELSQPLCTAIQIALVNAFKEIKVVPSAVIGHSSGEIAAAYASGNITARDAIVIAYFRGIISKEQVRAGGMAAVSLSLQEAEELLLPGVVVACENSSSSITLSGDLEPLSKVIDMIKHLHPGKAVSMLKVEKAYHSHHMHEVGARYEQLMTEAGVHESYPTQSVLFFSSVTGGLLGASAGIKFGAKYWKSNLERPVLFKTAFERITQHFALESPVFLEIGPHPALKGPIRQMLLQISSKAPHISTLVRREQDTESFLNTVGLLYTRHIAMDFARLIPQGSVVSDLPTYPWDHHRNFWYESRVSREWRQRRRPHHNLLGRRVLESTDNEPLWRNLFHLSNAPWISDHKVREDIIFPFTAYLAMAAEAAGQNTASQSDAIKFRRVEATAALLVDEEEPTEIITSLRRDGSTTLSDSDWWTFTISSHNGNVWTTNCSGQVRMISDYSKRCTSPPEVLPRKVPTQSWYDALSRKGFSYGHHFRVLEKLSTSTTEPNQAHAKLRNNWHGDESHYHLHPCLLDSLFQGSAVAALHGLTYAYSTTLAVGIEHLTVNRCATDGMDLSCTASLVGTIISGHGRCTVDSKTVFEFSGARLKVVGSGDTDASNQVSLAARCHWVPHFDFLEIRELMVPHTGHKKYARSLNDLTQIATALIRQAADGIDICLPHLRKYKAWLDENTSFADGIDRPTLLKKFDLASQALADTAAWPLVSAIRELCVSPGDTWNGKADPLGESDMKDTTRKIQGFMVDYDHAEILNSVGHQTPNMSVLQLGAGSGSSTSAILDSLTHAQGHSLYSRYVVADVSPGILNKAKETLQRHSRLEFAILDVSRDIDQQDFTGQEFDLIVANSVIQPGLQLLDSLSNAYKLLRPDGKLLIQAPKFGLSWRKLLQGMHPTWWTEDEAGNAVKRSTNVGFWSDKLEATGFKSSNITVHDTVEALSSVYITAVKTLHDQRIYRKISVVYRSDRTRIERFITELESCDYEVSPVSINDLGKMPPGRDVLILLDAEAPFFADITKDHFEQFQSFVNNLSGASVFWVTLQGQLWCTDPRYAQVIGIARTLRAEMNVNFATLEVDTLDVSSGLLPRIVECFNHFLGRSGGSIPGPDFEYAIHGGKVLVNRIFPVALKDNMSKTSEAHESSLVIGHVGQIESLQWSHVETGELLRDGDIEIAVHAVGLNFRDVLVAMGSIEVPELVFGYEAAGVVQRVGTGVNRFKEGQRVAFCGNRAFTTTLKAPETLFEHIPDDMSFIDAASIPLAFATALYALIEVGRLEQGQSVLVHSGAGGVGLAAVQVAQWIGAEVYVTVSSEEKIALLESYGVRRDHVFDSRSTTFVTGLMEATKDRGVDLALNSLSGDLLHATWSCIAKWGIMVEIGKKDLLEYGKLDMRAFLENRTYSCVDLDQMCRERPKMVQRLLKSTFNHLRQQHLRPLPVAKIVDATSIRETFLQMRQGKHIGKFVVRLRDNGGNCLVPRSQEDILTEPKLDSLASYLLVGGLGGIGRCVSSWLVRKGARHLIFLSRTAGQAQEHRDTVRELESAGCIVDLVQGSTTSSSDVEAALKKGVERDKVVKGVVNMAMALHDRAFSSMTIDEWNETCESKVQGTWALHNATRACGLDLDFFLLFSSLSGTIGQPGQANYASANTFLDAFVQYRTRMGLACSGLILGAMENVGHIVRDQDLRRKMQGQGWRMLQEEELFDALTVAMNSHSTSKASSPSKHGECFVDRSKLLFGFCPTTPLNEPSASTQLRSDVRLAAYHNIGGVSKGQSTSSTPNALRTFLANARRDPALLEKSETVSLLAEVIGKKLLGLVLRSNDEVDIRANTADLGLDSMVAVEMRAWWKVSFGSEISALEIRSVGTLEALGRKALAGLKILYCT